MITSFEINTGCLGIWTVKVEEHQPGEFIAWCSETHIEGVGTTEADAVEDFISACWPPQPIPVKVERQLKLATVVKFPLRGRMLERAIVGETIT